MKRILFFAISAVLAFSLAGTASAASASESKSITVEIDGESVDLGSSLYFSKGKTFVEYSVLLKQLGFETQFNDTTRTIVADAEGLHIEMSVGGDVAFVNGQTVDSKGEVRVQDGQTMLGLRFIGSISNYKVGWIGKTQTVTLAYLGPTDEQKAAVYDVFNKMLLIEASGDSEGLAALFSEDTALDVKALQEQWKTVKTKTTIHDKFIQSYSDQEATVIISDETTKLSGAFFPENKSQTRYTLHKSSDGTWKIYNMEVLAVEITNIPALFDQPAAIPDVDQAAIEKVLDEQLKASNEENIDAYMATLVDFEGKEAVAESVKQLFAAATQTITIEKMTIVEYNGEDNATLLISMISDVDANGTQAKVRVVLLNEAQKADGKWLLKSESRILKSEQL